MKRMQLFPRWRDRLFKKLEHLPFIQSQQAFTDLIIQHRGLVIPQGNIIELKTRNMVSGKSKMEWAKVIPQLVLSQTPNLFVGSYVQGGTIQRVDVYGAEQLAEREAAFQPSLRRLHAVLVAVQRRVVAQRAAAKLALVCSSGVLQLFARPGGQERLLPAVAQRFV